MIVSDSKAAADAQPNIPPECALLPLDQCAINTQFPVAKNINQPIITGPPGLSRSSTDFFASSSVRPSSVSRWPQRIRMTRTASGELSLSSLALQKSETTLPSTTTNDLKEEQDGDTNSLENIHVPASTMLIGTLTPLSANAATPVVTIGTDRRAPLLSELLTNNRKWARRMSSVNPEFFSTLARQQSPLILWIGCSDSRGKSCVSFTSIIIVYNSKIYPNLD
jgi:hypothetical protein